MKRLHRLFFLLFFVPALTLSNTEAIAQNTSADSLFTKYVRQADSLFEALNYNAAIQHYEMALAIKPIDDYAQIQINQCKKSISIVCGDGIQYEKIKAKALEYYNAGNYEKAKTYYERARNFRPSDKENKKMIAKCDRKIKP